MPHPAAFRFFPVWRLEPVIKGALRRAAPALDPGFKPAPSLMGTHSEFKRGFFCLLL
jgi:hypothetical protein